MRRRARYLVPLAWMAVIFYVSSRSTLPSAPEPWLDVVVKKTGHMVEYAILTFLWDWAMREDVSRPRTRMLIALGVAFLYAVSDEFHQRFVPGRGSRATDVLIDTVGASAMAYFLRRRAPTRDISLF